jgi:hypothetical protein
VSEHCPECGAPLATGGSCSDHFHTMLALEGTFPGAPGSILHFYLVACYNLQHPEGVGLTAAALHGLRRNLADALAGTPREQLLGRTRRVYDGPARVRRRPGDPPVEWYRGPWPMHVADLLAATADSYPDLVTAWARSIDATLTAQLGPPPASR